MILLDQAGAGELGSKLFPPGPALKGFVEHFWIQHSPVGAARHRPWRIVPDASPNIIMSVTRGSKRLEDFRAALVGPRSRFVDISVAKRALTLGVRLLPGTLPSLTRFPASDFTDRSLPLDESFGIPGRVLSEQLGDQRSAAQALDVLSAFLLEKFRHATPAGRVRAHDGSAQRVQDLARAGGVPNRTLYARIKEQVGLAPKRLLRVQRLHRALILRRDPSTPWAYVAAMGGFADQAHLVREFHQLLGESPGAWHARTLAADSYKTSQPLQY